MTQWRRVTFWAVALVAVAMSVTLVGLLALILRIPQ